MAKLKFRVNREVCVVNGSRTGTVIAIGEQTVTVLWKTREGEPRERSTLPKHHVRMVDAGTNAE